MKKKILLISLMSISSSLFAKSIHLDDLYSRYEQADYSSMELAEYHQTVDFQAVIVDVDQNLSGDALIEIASPTDPETTLARVVPASSSEVKFAHVNAGQQVKLECQLEMTMGSEYLGFGECELK